MAKRKSSYVRITPLGYGVLGIIALVVIITVVYVAWSARYTAQLKAANATQAPEPAVSGALEQAPTPTLPPLDTAEPTATPTAVPSATSSPSASLVNGVKLPTQEQEKSAVSGKLLNSGVVLRSGPGKGYDIIGFDYSQGTELKIYSQEDDYYLVQVVSQVKYGYMAVKFVAKYGLLPGEEATPAPTVPNGLTSGSVTASVIVLRSKPDKDDDTARIGEYGKDTVLWIYFKTKEFYYVKVVVDGSTGYMFADFVSPSGSVPEGTPVP